MGNFPSRVALALLIVSAAATGQAQQFCNSAPITIPDLGSASPYPSNIMVAGVSGTVGDLTVTLNNLQHDFSEDVDVLLKKPSGQKFIILSDVVDDFGFSTAATITLSDGAATALPSNSTEIPSGTYKPTNYGAGDTFAAPAPGGP